MSSSRRHGTKHDARCRSAGSNDALDYDWPALLAGPDFFREQFAYPWWLPAEVAEPLLRRSALARAESTVDHPEHLALVDLVTTLGIPLLDAAPVLRTALAERRAIFDRPFDPHCNPAGHALIADWLHAAGW